MCLPSSFPPPPLPPPNRYPLFRVYELYKPTRRTRRNTDEQTGALPPDRHRSPRLQKSVPCRLLCRSMLYCGRSLGGPGLSSRRPHSLTSHDPDRLDLGCMERAPAGWMTGEEMVKGEGVGGHTSGWRGEGREERGGRSSRPAAGSACRLVCPARRSREIDDSLSPAIPTRRPHQLSPGRRHKDMVAWERPRSWMGLPRNAMWLLHMQDASIPARSSAAVRRGVGAPFGDLHVQIWTGLRTAHIPVFITRPPRPVALWRRRPATARYYGEVNMKRENGKRERERGGEGERVGGGGREGDEAQKELIFFQPPPRLGA